MKKKPVNQIKKPSVDLVALRRAYELYADQCESGLGHVVARINDFRAWESHTDDYNLFDSVHPRIKEFDSVREKMGRKYKKLPLTIENIKLKIMDVAGIRIVVPFKDDIARVQELLQNRLVVVEVKDYINNPKENGYRSLHLQVQAEVPWGTTLITVPIEIQIRTKAMDVWASIEHIIYYKNRNTRNSEAAPEVVSRLKAIADALDTIDNMAMELRDLDLAEKLIDTIASPEKLAALLKD